MGKLASLTAEEVSLGFPTGHIGAARRVARSKACNYIVCHSRSQKRCNRACRGKGKARALQQTGMGRAGDRRGGQKE